MTIILEESAVAQRLSGLSRPGSVQQSTIAAIIPAEVTQPVDHGQQTCRLDGCSFCNLARGMDDRFVELYGASPEVNIPGLPEDVLVLMDGFPIGSRGGHLLVVPRQHVPALSQAPNVQGLREAVERVADILSAMFPDYWLFTFEHGMGHLSGKAVKCGGCHVDHAHGHIVLLPKSVDFEEIREAVEQTLEELGWDLNEQSAESQVPFTEMADFVGGQPYLQIGRLGGGQRISITYRQEASSNSIPSQLLRRIVSEASGKPAPIHWNWKIALERNIAQRLEQYRRDAIGFKTAVADYVEANGG